MRLRRQPGAAAVVVSPPAPVLLLMRQVVTGRAAKSHVSSANPLFFPAPDHNIIQGQFSVVEMDLWQQRKQALGTVPPNNHPSCPPTAPKQPRSLLALFTSGTMNRAAEKE